MPEHTDIQYSLFLDFVTTPIVYGFSSDFVFSLRAHPVTAQTPSIIAAANLNALLFRSKIPISLPLCRFSPVYRLFFLISTHFLYTIIYKIYACVSTHNL